MKHNFLILFLIFSYTLSTASPLEVKIKGLKDKEIHVEVFNLQGELLKKEVISCKNGAFTYENNFDIPIQLEMIPSGGLLDTKSIRGVVKRQTMTIVTFLSSREGCKITGTCKDGILTYQVKDSEKNEILADLRSKYIEMHRYYDMEQEYFRDNKTKEQRDSVYYIGEEIKVQQNKEKLSYVEANPGKELSGLFFSELSNGKAKEVYSTLTPDVVNGMFKNAVSRKKYTLDLLQKAEQNKVGATAPDFALKGLDGKEIKLSDLKGRYVFLYFWGSWCRWCLQGLEQLNQLKTNYDGKVEFIGIASRDTETTLKACIKEKGILWESYFDKDIHTGESVPFLYGVTGYPHKVLIDPNGKIVLICEGADPEFYKAFDAYMEGK